MRPNELMIGDYVRFKHGIDKVVGVSWVPGLGDCAWFAASATLFPESVEDVNPIPLTPEILENNGWYRAKFDGGYGRKGIRLEGSYNELNELPEGVENALCFAQWSIDEHFEYHLLDIYMWKGSVHLWTEYVHELQHALRLCGIDKEITI